MTQARVSQDGVDVLGAVNSAARVSQDSTDVLLTDPTTNVKVTDVLLETTVIASPSIVRVTNVFIEVVVITSPTGAITNAVTGATSTSASVTRQGAVSLDETGAIATSTELDAVGSASIDGTVSIGITGPAVNESVSADATVDATASSQVVVGNSATIAATLAIAIAGGKAIAGAVSLPLTGGFVATKDTHAIVSQDLLDVLGALDGKLKATSIFNEVTVVDATTKAKLTNFFIELIVLNAVAISGTPTPFPSTPNLKIRHIAYGQDAKEVQFANSIDALDISENSALNITMNSGDPPFTVISYPEGGQARTYYLKVSGTLAVDSQVLLPKTPKVYLAKNSTAVNVEFRTDTNAGIVLATGKTQWLFFDGNAIIALAAAI